MIQGVSADYKEIQISASRDGALFDQACVNIDAGVLDPRTELYTDGIYDCNFIDVKTV